MVVAMCRDGAAARDFARRHAVPEWTDDAGAVMGSGNVDVVYVATPPSSHLQYVRAAAAAGKHVLVEKPMALNAAEARLIVEACASAGVELFVAYYRRFQPHSIAKPEWGSTPDRGRDRLPSPSVTASGPYSSASSLSRAPWR